MTKSTITREQLEEWVAQFDEDGGCDATDRQLGALIRQSLAAMDSEPVAEVVSIYGDPEAFGEREIRPLVGIQQMPYGTKLYRHAQPAPVVPEEMPCGGAADDYHDGYQDGWNACRAAMLHAGNSPAQSGCCPAQNSVVPAQSGSSPAIPDGYVLVPKEATKEILDEFDSIIDYGAEDSVDAWHRLLAAATQEVKP